MKGALAKVGKLAWMVTAVMILPAIVHLGARLTENTPADRY